MNIIRAYPLSMQREPQDVVVPVGSMLLSVGASSGGPCLFVAIDDDQTVMTTISALVVRNEQSIQKCPQKMVYVGFVTLHEGMMVVHVLSSAIPGEIINKEPK